MATNFPTSLDSFTNPSSSSTLDSPSHAAQHANINDAMVAVQTKLGVGTGTIGEWTSFTPVWGNVTVGNGTVTAEYCRVNEIVFYRIKLVFGSTTAFTGDIELYFPFLADDNILGALGGSVSCDDATGGDYWGTLYRRFTNRAYVRVFRTDSTYLNEDGVGTNTPFTWTTGDVLAIEDWYRPA